MLVEVQAPLALLRGERDRVVPLAAMRALAADRPQALAETIPDCGHVPQLERPGKFVAVVECALARLAAVTDS